MFSTCLADCYLLKWAGASCAKESHQADTQHPLKDGKACPSRGLGAQLSHCCPSLCSDSCLALTLPGEKNGGLGECPHLQPAVQVMLGALVAFQTPGGNKSCPLHAENCQQLILSVSLSGYLSQTASKGWLIADFW